MTLPRPILRIGWAIHKALFRATGGRVGAQRAGVGRGTLFLLTTGRKSGMERRNALYYIEDGPDFVIVGSNAGEDADPNWWHNLQANPDAVVMIGPKPIPVRARQASAKGSTRLWPRLDAANPEYVAYRRKTARAIPVVIRAPR